MYVEQITGRTDREVTDVTNAKIRKGVLSYRMCGAPLYKILQRYNLYKSTRQNWSYRIKAKGNN